MPYLTTIERVTQRSSIATSGTFDHRISAAEAIPAAMPVVGDPMFLVLTAITAGDNPTTEALEVDPDGDIVCLNPDWQLRARFQWTYLRPGTSGYPWRRATMRLYSKICDDIVETVDVVGGPMISFGGACAMWFVAKNPATGDGVRLLATEAVYEPDAPTFPYTPTVVSDPVLPTIDVAIVMSDTGISATQPGWVLEGTPGPRPIAGPDGSARVWSRIREEGEPFPPVITAPNTDPRKYRWYIVFSIAPLSEGGGWTWNHLVIGPRKQGFA